MVNPRRVPMAKKAKKARKKNARRKSHRAKNPTRRRRKGHRAKNPGRRRHRRKNPSGTGIMAAFGGGFLAKLGGDIAAEGMEMLIPKKHNKGIAKTVVRIGGKLLPLGAAYVLNSDAKNPSPFVFGMAGGAGAGVEKEIAHHIVKMGKGGTVPSWGKWLGEGSGAMLKLPDGSILYHDKSKGPMMLPALAEGQVGPPKPLALPAGAQGLVQIKGLEFSNQLGEKLMAIGEMPDGSVLYRDHANRFDTMSGMSMEELDGLVTMGGLVEMSGHGDMAEPEGLAGMDDDEDDDEVEEYD